MPYQRQRWRPLGINAKASFTLARMRTELSMIDRYRSSPLRTVKVRTMIRSRVAPGHCVTGGEPDSIAVVTGAILSLAGSAENLCAPAIEPDVVRRQPVVDP
jgi:hypothetical protein